MSGRGDWLLGGLAAAAIHAGAAGAVLAFWNPEPVAEQTHEPGRIDLAVIGVPEDVLNERPAEGEALGAGNTAGAAIGQTAPRRVTGREVDAAGAEVAALSADGAAVAPEVGTGEDLAPIRAGEAVAPVVSSGDSVVATTDTGPVLAPYVEPAAAVVAPVTGTSDRIEGAAPQPVLVAAVSAEVTSLTDAVPSQSALTTATAPTGTVVALVAPSPDPTQAEQPRAERLSSSPTETAASLAAAAPPSPAVPATAGFTVATAAVPGQTGGQSLEPGTADSTDLPPAIPETDVMTAALAWTGGGDQALAGADLGLIETLLLGAPDAGGAELRDGIARTLKGVPCARLHTVFVPETGTLELRGHVPDPTLAPPLVSALAASLGGSIPVAQKLRVLPSPQCDALTGIEALGLPQSTDQLTNPAMIGEDAHVREYDYQGGQDLVLDLTTPDYPAHVYIDFYAADGNVLHLTPSDFMPLTRHDPDTAFRVGTAEDGGTRLVVSPPYGQEIAVAYAASVPLYDDPRPFSEPAAAYLEFLRDEIARRREEHPDFRGEWVYFFIATRAPD